MEVLNRFLEFTKVSFYRMYLRISWTHIQMEKNSNTESNKKLTIPNLFIKERLWLIAYELNGQTGQLILNRIFRKHKKYFYLF